MPLQDQNLCHTTLIKILYFILDYLPVLFFPQPCDFFGNRLAIYCESSHSLQLVADYSSINHGKKYWMVWTVQCTFYCSTSTLCTKAVNNYIELIQPKLPNTNDAL